MVALAAALVAPPASARADRDCGDFSSQRAAQIFFLNQGGPDSDPHGLDSDGDGIACESNPAPYYYGSTPPDSNEPKPEPKITHVRSSVRLALIPNKRIAGETFRVKVSVERTRDRSQGRAPAQGQRALEASRHRQHRKKGNGLWRVQGAQGEDGLSRCGQGGSEGEHEILHSHQSDAHAHYSTAAGVLDFNDRWVAEGHKVRATVRATPIRAGRTVVLQVRSAGTWRTVETGSLNRRGRASFAVTPEVGRHAYRAVAQRHRGAAPKTSRTTTVTATDATPPPVPHDLVAMPANASVTLTWSQDQAGDVDHYEVWMRTADTDWSRVASSYSLNAEISPLTNGVTYWFAVSSVDSNGNASLLTNEVAATPVAPE